MDHEVGADNVLFWTWHVALSDRGFLVMVLWKKTPVVNFVLVSTAQLRLVEVYDSPRWRPFLARSWSVCSVRAAQNAWDHQFSSRKDV